jgi:hypothetical protein
LRANVLSHNVPQYVLFQVTDIDILLVSELAHNGLLLGVIDQGDLHVYSALIEAKLRINDI